MAAATVAPAKVNPSWATHKWSEPDGRRVEIERGKPLTQRYCRECGRTFVEDHASKSGGPLRRVRLTVTGGGAMRFL